MRNHHRQGRRTTLVLLLRDEGQRSQLRFLLDRIFPGEATPGGAATHEENQTKKKNYPHDLLNRAGKGKHFGESENVRNEKDKEDEKGETEYGADAVTTRWCLVNFLR